MEQDVRSLSGLIEMLRDNTLPFLAAFFGVYVLSRLLHTCRDYWSNDDPPAAARTALAATGASMLILMLILFGNKESQGQSQAQSHFDAGDLAAVVFLSALYLAPVVIGILRRHEPLGSIGFTTRNWVGAVIIGTAACVAAALTETDFVWRGWSLRGEHFWALAYFFVVSVAEEGLFRGYFQTRMMAWMGKWPGWIAASLVMAFAHLGIRILWQNYTFAEAIYNTLSVVPTSLFLGYLMLRTGNLIAPIMGHTFGNWMSAINQISDNLN